MDRETLIKTIADGLYGDYFLAQSDVEKIVRSVMDRLDEVGYDPTAEVRMRNYMRVFTITQHETTWSYVEDLQRGCWWARYPGNSVQASISMQVVLRTIHEALMDETYTLVATVEET